MEHEYIDFNPKFNPTVERKLAKHEQDALSEKTLAEQLSERREKMTKAGELNRETGLGKAVNDLEDYVLKNTTTELHKLSLDEIGELVKKFDLPYDKEAVYLAADIFDRQRKQESH